MREELAKAQTIFALHWRVGAKTFSPLGATPFLVEDNSALHASLTVMSAFSALSLSLWQRGKKRRQQTFIGLLSRLGKVKSTRLHVQRIIKFHQMEMETFLAAARGLSDLQSNQVKRGDWILTGPLGMMRRCWLTNDGEGDEKKGCDDFIRVLSRERVNRSPNGVCAPRAAGAPPRLNATKTRTDSAYLDGRRGKGVEEQPADSLAKITSRIGRGDFSSRKRRA